MKISWGIDDGYVGKSRPQTTYIDDDELKECDDFTEAMNLIENSVKDDFEQKVGFNINEIDEIEEKVRSLFEK